MSRSSAILSRRGEDTSHSNNESNFHEGRNEYSENSRPRRKKKSLHTANWSRISRGYTDWEYKVVHALLLKQSYKEAAEHLSRSKEDGGEGRRVTVQALYDVTNGIRDRVEMCEIFIKTVKRDRKLLYPENRKWLTP